MLKLKLEIHMSIHTCLFIQMHLFYYMINLHFNKAFDKYIFSYFNIKGSLEMGFSWCFGL